MTKEYLSKFIGYYTKRVTDGHDFYNAIVLIRHQWYLPNVGLKFDMIIRRTNGGFVNIIGPSQDYEEALSKVKEYFDGK